MKKIVVLLLALTFAGSVFAQVNTSVSASGEIILTDETGQAQFYRYGAGYDLLTFKAAAENDTFGFSTTLDDFLLEYIQYVAADSLTSTNEVKEKTPFTAFRDWNIWFKNDVIKIILGKIRNGDFRTAMPGGYLGRYLVATDRFFGGAAYGIVAESTFLGPLTLGLGLPIPDITTPSLNVIQQTNIGASYAFEGIGTLKSLVRLDFVSNIHAINCGFDYSGIKNLLLDAFFKVTFPDTNTFSFGLGSQYTIAPFIFAAEWDGEYDNNTTFNWELYAHAAYIIIKNLRAMLGGTLMSDMTYNAFVRLGYDLFPGVTSTVMGGYDGQFYYKVNLYYTINF